MKPDIDTLGVCGALSVHEKALRDAQETIDKLRARVKELEAELAIWKIGKYPHSIVQHERITPQPQRVVVAPIEHQI